jgi:hypothetical protein
MTICLTIPGIVDQEDLHSLQRESDRSFHIVLAAGTTATELFHAASSGRHYELMLLTIEPTMILALDDVYVSQASIGSGEPQLLSATLDAGSVRVA